jgi:hypothetical protein
MDRLEHRYNVGSVSKRAQGSGRITAVSGLEALLAEYGEHVMAIDLLPVGAPRRDWRATTIGDGIVFVRHRELQQVIDMTERFASDLHLHAG